ncbi:MAG: hypothetical protein KAV82_08905 [Phycisphaerae bacterium]|nr:hypothetical protein [Phycisphaerae bacterium]
MSGRERTSGDDGTVLEFDLNAGFFKKKKYPGTIFARRYQNIEPRPFRAGLETTTSNFGLVWQYVSEKTPTSFQITHTDVKLHPLDPQEDDGRQKNTTARFETSYKFNDHNVVSLLYEHQAVEEQPFELDYDSDEITLTHSLNFGGNHRHQLESELNYFDQRGTFNVERLRWREILRFNHSDQLRSWHYFEFLDRVQGSFSGVEPSKERSYSISSTVEHLL